MSEVYDAIVIGAGHNGLVTAAYLSRAGLRTLVIEERGVIGGAASSEEFIEGYIFSPGADEAALLVPDIIDDLRLRRWGLAFHESPTALTALNPGGKPLTLWRDSDRNQAELQNGPGREGERLAAFLADSERYNQLVGEMMRLPPPEIAKGLERAQVTPWLNPALRLRRMGGDEMMAFLRLLPMSVAELLSERLEHSLIRGALALLAVRGSFAGPMAAGTAFQYLFHAPSSGLVGNRDTRFVKGGIGALASALAKALQSFRGEVRTGCRVARILVDKGRATGVALDSGEELRSGLVVSSADPRVTYFQLLDPAELPLKVVRRVKNIRFRGSTAKLNLALSGLPHFEGVEGLEPLMGQIILCPAVEYLERAYDHAKYGRMSGSPALEVLIPSLLEPALAPPGGHVMSIVVRYTPYHLREGGWDQLAEVLADRVLDQLAAYAPDIKEKIVGRQILTPLDLERRLALSEGSIYHGQMGLDQLLFMRPIPGFGRYRTPIEGLYLCGAGTHPGGGVSGAPGYNAARVIHQNWMG